MSKSKGEFLTVSLLEEKGYDPLVYRFFCLQSHYRKSLVFTWENLDNAAGTFQKLIGRIAALRPGDGPVDPEAQAALKEKFSKALDNDLNTALAVTALYDVLKAKTNDATKLAALGTLTRSWAWTFWRRPRPSGRRPLKASAQPPGLRHHRRGDPAIDALVLQRRGQEGQELRRGRPHPGRAEGPGHRPHRRARRVQVESRLKALPRNTKQTKGPFRVWKGPFLWLI